MWSHSKTQKGRLKNKGAYALTSKITNRNTVQVPNLESVKEGRVTVAATGLYTVPTGRVAIVKSISGNLDAVGADATYAVAILRAGTYRPVGLHVAVNAISVYTGEMLLIAGDIITNIGDAGSTNGTIDMTASVKEYPA